MSFLNTIRSLSENIKIFDQEIVRSGNDRILMQKIEWCNTPVTERSQWDSDETLPCVFGFRGRGLTVFKFFMNCHAHDLCHRYLALFRFTWFKKVIFINRNEYFTSLLYIIIKRNNNFGASIVVFLDGIIAYTKRKTMYFAVCSSIPQLKIQIFSEIDLFSIMQHALFFSSCVSGGKW